MTKLSLIAAMDENQLIGSNNGLPWQLPADLAFFKRTTMGKPVLMGRKTFESIGRPLPGRRNIIITRDSAYEAPGCEIVHDINAAMELTADCEETMLIGGASLYEQTIELANVLYITRIAHAFQGDTWFPQFDLAEWTEAWREAHEPDEKNAYSYAFLKFVRQN